MKGRGSTEVRLVLSVHQYILSGQEHGKQGVADAVPSSATCNLALWSIGTKGNTSEYLPLIVKRSTALGKMDKNKLHRTG